MRFMGLTRPFFLLAAVLSLGAGSALAQQAASEGRKVDKQSQPKASAAKDKEKPSLAEATRVSTADAVRETAADAARPKNGEAQGSGAPDVLEFRPADAATRDDGEATVVPKGKSTLKNIHGNAYGLDSASGKQAGGAVGVTSKKGKSSVYVETNHQTASEPH